MSGHRQVALEPAGGREKRPFGRPCRLFGRRRAALVMRPASRRTTLLAEKPARPSDVSPSCKSEYWGADAPARRLRETEKFTAAGRGRRRGGRRGLERFLVDRNQIDGRKSALRRGAWAAVMPGASQGPRDERVRARKAALRVAFRGHWRAYAPLDDVQTSPARRLYPGAAKNDRISPPSMKVNTGIEIPGGCPFGPVSVRARAP